MKVVKYICSQYKFVWDPLETECVSAMIRIKYSDVTHENEKIVKVNDFVRTSHFFFEVDVSYPLQFRGCGI